MAVQTTTVDINDASEKLPTEDGLDTDEEPAVTSNMLPSSEPRPQPSSTQGDDHILSSFDYRLVFLNSFISFVLFSSYRPTLYVQWPKIFNARRVNIHVSYLHIAQRCNHIIQINHDPCSLI